MSLKRQMQETTFSLRCAHKVVKIRRKKYYGFDMPFRLCLSTSPPLFPSLLFSLYFPSPFIPFLLSYFVLFLLPLLPACFDLTHSLSFFRLHPSYILPHYPFTPFPSPPHVLPPSLNPSPLPKIMPRDNMS